VHEGAKETLRVPAVSTQNGAVTGTADGHGHGHGYPTQKAKKSGRAGRKPMGVAKNNRLSDPGHGAGCGGVT
jgi:hypothetical protein